MAEPSEIEPRVAALEGRIEEVAADAAAARHLAAAGNRDLAGLGVKVDANRAAINALGVQSAGRFDEVDRRFELVDQRFERLENEMRTGFAEVGTAFAEMRAKFDQVAGGQEQIVELLTGLIADRPDQ
jgi:hypothetical protein